jgi:hypothetical protein
MDRSLSGVVSSTCTLPGDYRTNAHTAEAKNEKFMRFNMGEDALDGDDGFAADDEAAMAGDEQEDSAMI